jgi:hypothetical protein
VDKDLFARLAEVAIHKAKVRAAAGQSPASSLAASMVGLGMLSEVVADNAMSPNIEELDFQKLCQGATIAVAEIAILLQCWDVDLGNIMEMFLDALEDSKEQGPKPTAPILQLVSESEEPT